jgi:hypothetical protein
MDCPSPAKSEPSWAGRATWRGGEVGSEDENGEKVDAATAPGENPAGEDGSAGEGALLLEVSEAGTARSSDTISVSGSVVAAGAVST